MIYMNWKPDRVAGYDNGCRQSRGAASSRTRRTMQTVFCAFSPTLPGRCRVDAGVYGSALGRTAR